jgi:hypothetical protein
LFLLGMPGGIAYAAGAPGGFIETPATAQGRPLLSSSQIESLLPNRGKFTFPAPYNTEAFRLTNPSDCGGNDCVHYVGYSYWRNTNNHVGQDTMLILVGLRRTQGGSGPSLVAYNKVTDQIEPLGPIFNQNSSFSWANAEGMYFSGTLPTALYVVEGSRLLRHDVLNGSSETVFDVSAELGGGYRIFQAHSSDDDRVHSATLQNSAYQSLGCVVYREDRDEVLVFNRQGNFDECQVDRSGDWLVIKENVDGQAGEDNRIINLDTGNERVLYDQNGAGGHSDLGHGYMVAADNWANDANTQKLWKFDGPLQGTPVYNNDDWSAQAPAHVSHTNSIPGVSAENQYACGSSANSRTSTHANEVVCFPLSGTKETLVVAPVMTSLSAGGGGDTYGKSPKGNLDVTGRYFIWTSNMRSDRLDVFLVKVPAHLLTGEEPEPVPPPPPPPPEPTRPPLIFKDNFETDPA